MKKSENNENKKISRRSFFNKIWITLGTIAGIEVLGVLSTFWRNDKESDNKNDKYIIAGNVDDFKLNSVTPFRNGKFYLSRLGDGGFVALSIKCTHLGCSVGWNEGEEMFICPCHSSSFKLNGDVQSPPASRALDYFPVKIENGIIKVNVGKAIKRNQFSKSQVTYVEA